MMREESRPAATDAPREYDTVRVVALHGPAEPRVQGTSLRAPAVGDEGSVLEVFAESAGEPRVLVEAVAPDGATVWLAELRADELERVHRPG